MRQPPSTLFEATLEAGVTGLVGTLQLGILDNEGAYTQPLDGADIIETPAGSGFYAATRTSPDTGGQYTLIWSLDGTTDPDQISTEELVVGYSIVSPGPSGPAYATKAQLAAVLPGITSPGSRDDDLDRVLLMATVEIDSEMDYADTPSFTAAQLKLLEHVCLERAGDLWHMETVQAGLLLSGDTPLLAPRNSWDRYANMLAPLKSRWGVA